MKTILILFVLFSNVSVSVSKELFTYGHYLEIINDTSQYKQLSQSTTIKGKKTYVIDNFIKLYENGKLIKYKRLGGISPIVSQYQYDTVTHALVFESMYSKTSGCMVQIRYSYNTENLLYKVVGMYDQKLYECTYEYDSLKRVKKEIIQQNNTVEEIIEHVYRNSPNYYEEKEIIYFKDSLLSINYEIVDSLNHTRLFYTLTGSNSYVYETEVIYHDENWKPVHSSIVSKFKYDNYNYFYSNENPQNWIIKMEGDFLSSTRDGFFSSEIKENTEYWKIENYEPCSDLYR